jgi:hypothetical protein
MNAPVKKEINLVPEEEEPVTEIKDTPSNAMKKQFKSDKPEFKRPVECRIVSAKFQTDGIPVKIETTREGKQIELTLDKQYKKHWLNVRFSYFDQEEKKEKEFEQAYSGIREYSNRLWTGNTNNLAKLKGLLEAFISVPIENIWDIGKELENKKCLVKSENYDFGTNKGYSNKIIDFVEENKK